MKAQDLIKMTWYKNADNKYHCPVRFREFTDNSHIVCNMVTGNVYSMEAITELCYKNKNMKDLINDKPFKRSDIITVQGKLVILLLYFKFYPRSRLLGQIQHSKFSSSEKWSETRHGQVLEKFYQNDKSRKQRHYCRAEDKRRKSFNRSANHARLNRSEKGK